MYVAHMDILSPNTTTTAAAAATGGGVKTPENESETPSRTTQSVKPLTFANGVLKRRHHTHLAAPPPPSASAVTYKECLKNHAASLGGHAVDGCGEFMPSPNATAGDPTSLKCAACGCHRNFHRRDPDDLPPPHPPASSAAAHQQVIEYQPHHRHHPPPPPRGGDSSPNSPSPPPISSTYYPSAPHMLLALSSGGLSGNPPEYNPSPTKLSGRKRFRTKFTAEQKEKMQEMAEKLGWKFQKRDEETISELCNELGIERGVFKVWMHNNKAAFGKKDTNTTNVSNHSIDTAATATTTDHHHHNENLNHHVVVTNGSSSSS